MCPPEERAPHYITIITFSTLWGFRPSTLPAPKSLQELGPPPPPTEEPPGKREKLLWVAYTKRSDYQLLILKMAAFRETSLRVNIEFLRASQPGVGRVIRFNHSPAIIPSQLLGRVSLEEWQRFMTDVDTLAKHHPYVQPPEARHMVSWAGCFAIGSVLGLFCINPDAGEYGGWLQEAATVLSLHKPIFDRAGCTVALLGGRDHWIQIDIDPSRPWVPVVAEGAPVVLKPGQVPPSPFASAK